MKKGTKLRDSEENSQTQVFFCFFPSENLENRGGAIESHRMCNMFVKMVFPCKSMMAFLGENPK